MTEVIHFPSPSSSSSSSSTCVTNDIPLQQQQQQQPPSSSRRFNPTSSIELDQDSREREVSIAELLAAVFRRSIVGCSVTAASKELCKMEIGVPTGVRHVAHVTFDRFNGFLGLPVEFEPEVPRRPPSASATVFGVSTESMQLSYDTRGNSVPTILLMMQRHLYAQGGLQVEGIFRINADNSQEEYVRDQLNKGVIPEGIDVHCLAGLIKAWFRELPTGVLDSLSPEQVMQSQTEEECAQLARLLPPTEAALLDWAINLMADVAQLEHLNKMNARNVAMVFAPNMTHMSDPLTALMYAVQVMNFLRTLIFRALREREDSVVDSNHLPRVEPPDEENDHPSFSHLYVKDANEEATSEDEDDKLFINEDPSLESPHQPPSQEDSSSKDSQTFLTSIENIPGGTRTLIDNCPCDVASPFSTPAGKNQGGDSACKTGTAQTKTRKSRIGQSSNSNVKKGPKKPKDQSIARVDSSVEKSKGTGIVDRINRRTELSEAWR